MNKEINRYHIATPFSTYYKGVLGIIPNISILPPSPQIIRDHLFSPPHPYLAVDTHQ